MRKSPNLTLKEQEEISNRNFFLLIKKLCNEHIAFLSLQTEALKEQLKKFLRGEQAEQKAKDDLALLMTSKIAPIANKQNDATSWLDKLTAMVQKFATEFTATVETFRNTAIANADLILQKHKIHPGTPAHQAVHTVFEQAPQPTPLLNNFITFQANPQFTPAQQKTVHPAMHQHITRALTPRPAPSATRKHHDEFEQGLAMAAVLFEVGAKAHQELPQHRELTVTVIDDLLICFQSGQCSQYGHFSLVT